MNKSTTSSPSPSYRRSVSNSTRNTPRCLNSTLCRSSSTTPTPCIHYTPKVPDIPDEILQQLDKEIKRDKNAEEEEEETSNKSNNNNNDIDRNYANMRRYEEMEIDKVYVDRLRKKLGKYKVKQPKLKHRNIHSKNFLEQVMNDVKEEINDMPMNMNDCIYLFIIIIIIN